ncbi:hypothetical protein GCM10022600_25080 [Qipengyuania pelagi]|jgi:hypothetical protein|uniref:Uncharacterized protein n=1 Tax=Qipengyuania pelagi TaxID=994320 RepID=A0A844Y6K3_9SPHN|nr:hypothetical protein [Qipengyuania pelagi]MXO52652.1 hypothetical protein [Qipengyuania pelagi]
MNPELKQALDAFRINRCSLSTGIDAAHEILPQIHGIATLMEMGFRKEGNGEALFDNANPELVAAALDGIANLAALAMLNMDEL